MDVTYRKATHWQEVGLVDHPPGKKPRHPTLFVSARCITKKDEEWFRCQINEIMRRSDKR
jgi:hypothetical protein